MPYIGINKSLSPNNIKNDTDPSDIISDLQVSYHKLFPVRQTIVAAFLRFTSLRREKHIGHRDMAALHGLTTTSDQDLNDINVPFPDESVPK